MAEYRKPELAILGDAGLLIEGSKPKAGDNHDLMQPAPDPEELSD